MNQNPLVRIALQYGAYTGLASFAFFLLLYFLGFNPLGPGSWLAIWIPVVFIVLATRLYRDHELGGYISYWKAVGVGLLVVVASAVMYDLLLYIFFVLIDPSLVQLQLNQDIESMERAKGMFSEENYEKLMAQFEKNKDKYTAGGLSVSNFEGKLIVGFIISLITAAVLRKEKPFFEPEQPE